MGIIDLRSDTITQPTETMRKAMADAKVGDDVFGEDPTVNRLEEMAAEMLGKEAAVFVASGTMANLVSQLTHCGRGDEMILGDQAHMFVYEQGGSAAIGGIHPRAVPNFPDGKLALNDIAAAIRADNIHFPRTKLIALENTHNRCAGSPLDKDYMRSVKELAQKNGIKVHIDGARLFNAAIALNIKAADLAAGADSVSICLSKGLAAPVGSLVCGDSDFILEARRNRKVLGGGMRQAGILAAAGIIALKDMVDRLAEDHANAKKLASGLAEIKGLIIDPTLYKTNIVYFDVTAVTAQDMAEKLKTKGVKVLPTGPYRLRAVTNYNVNSNDIDHVLKVFSKIIPR